LSGKGDWTVDFHGKLDMPDAIALANMIEPLRPFWAEDLVRNEAYPLYRQIRQAVRVPLATGYGNKFEVRDLIELQLVDYIRVMIPSCGGITELFKVASLCETHFVGMIPESGGPISTAAEVHVAAATNVPFLLQIGRTTPQPYLPQSFDFRQGKVYVNERPGLGVEFDPKQATLITEVTKAGNIGGMFRPDGSYTNW
jgi:L-alanine-DL-glutamate epimerase-like enolase superfamily enzyme